MSRGASGNFEMVTGVSGPMQTLRRSTTVAFLLSLALLVIACGAGPGPSSSAPVSPDPSTSTGGPVDATGDWRLVNGTNDGVAIPIVADADITLDITGSSISGRSACNQYGGEVVVRDGQVQFGDLFMTEMACAEPVMASEAAYHAALAKVRAATRDGDTLTLSGPGVELVFELVVPPPAAELVETDWVLDSIITGDAVSSAMGGPAGLRFGADGSMAGSTGCRAFTARYVDAEGITMVSDLALDAVACPGDLAAQDAAVVAVLGERFRAVVEGQHLTLAAAGDQGLGYMTRSPEIPPAP
jgi:heat shock protein HslJ